MGGAMILRTMAGVTLACVAAWARAATLEEDEARIEALIRAERAERVATADKSMRLATEVPAPVAASVVAPTPMPNDEWLVSPTRRAGLPFAELVHHVGARVSITTAGERVHRGVVGSADARQVTLRVKRRGGNATYTLIRKQVLRVDLR